MLKLIIVSAYADRLELSLTWPGTRNNRGIL
jgi:hypothetical protein